MIFYRSFYESLDGMTETTKAQVYDAIFIYGLDFKEPTFTDAMAKSLFTLIKPQIDANVKKYHNGKKPKLKQEISKTEAKDKQVESKTEGNVNVNVNVNDNDNLNLNKEEKEVLLKEWIAYRKEIKKQLSEATINKLKEEMNSYTDEKCRYVINTSIRNGWQGLFWDKYVEKSESPKQINISDDNTDYTEVNEMLKKRQAELMNQFRTQG